MINLASRSRRLSVRRRRSPCRLRSDILARHYHLNTIRQVGSRNDGELRIKSLNAEDLPVDGIGSEQGCRRGC